MRHLAEMTSRLVARRRTLGAKADVRTIHNVSTGRTRRCWCAAPRTRTRRFVGGWGGPTKAITDWQAGREGSVQPVGGELALASAPEGFAN
jgi:hypothetical protein